MLDRQILFLLRATCFSQKITLGYPVFLDHISEFA